MSPGRNDPCPCGSGRKFKRCHGAAASGASLPTAHDRDQAYELLASLANLPRFSEDMDDAYGMIAGLEGVFDEAILETAAGSLYLEWSWFDYILHTGRSIAEFALERHERDLTPGGRRFLRACMPAPMRLMQVTRVESGASVEVKDLFDRGRPIAVAEHTGSQQMVLHDVFIGRVVTYERECQFEGTAIQVPIHDKARLIDGVRRLRRLLNREFRNAPPQELIRMTTGAALVIGAIELFERPIPHLQTTDGDELAFANVRFDIGNRAALETGLNSARDLERNASHDADPDGEISYSWLESDSDPDAFARRVLGRVVVTDSTLIVETMSMSRARLAQRFFTELATTAVRFVAIDVTGFDEMLRRGNHASPAEEVDPAIAGPIEREMMERHYRSWLDEAVPALGDRTPREAAAEKHWRQRVIALVEGIENQAARSARDGKGFDVTFLRSELGLRRRK